MLIANVTSYYSNSDPDPSSILDKGDHPFIQHKSFVYWEKARIVDAAGLNRAIENGLLPSRTSFSKAVLDGIVAGGKRSQDLRADCRMFLD